MSTKTSFKRIALVAATALAIGGFSAVSPANAANDATFTTTSLNITKYTASPVVNAAVAVNLGGVFATNAGIDTADSTDFTAVLTNYPSGGYVGATAAATTAAGAAVAVMGDDFSAAGATAAGATLTRASAADNFVGGTVTSSSTVGIGSFSFTPTVAGAYTLTIWNDLDQGGDIDPLEARQTIDITVAAVTGFSPQLSTSYVQATGTFNVAADDEVRVSSAANTDGASIQITLNNTSGTAYTGGGTLDVQVISGPGLVDAVADGTAYADATARADTLAIATGTSAARVAVTADGTSGTSKIRIRLLDATTGASLGTIAEETVYFYGTVATLVATKVFSVAKASTTAIGCSQVDCTQATVAETPFVTIVAKDAEGNLVPGLTVTGVSSDSTVIGSSSVVASTTKVNTSTGAAACAAGTAECNGLGYYNADVAGATGAASGKSATITYRTLLSGTTYITATAVTITIGGAIATETLSLDKASYDAGEAMVVTRTAKDAAGNAPYDGQTAGEVTFNKPVSGAVGDSWYISGKKATSATSPSVYAPAASGAFIAKMTSAVDGVTQITTTSAVTGDESASLALDAANAATDAANNAYDEAQNATQAASDALAAVTALAAQVKSLIASVKKLTAAVAKLKK